MSVSAIIVAAGRGERLKGGNVPKAFFPLSGKPLLFYSLDLFCHHPEVTQVIVALRPEMMGEAWKKQFGKEIFPKNPELVLGAQRRADSVWAAFQKISRGQEIVLIHDAARPFLELSLVSSVIQAARQWGAAIPGVRLKPTVKEVGEENYILKTHDRSKLWEAQTPQGFKVELLRKAFEKAGPRRQEATDEAFLMEQMGIPVKMIEGNEKNIKITTPADLKWAEFLMKEECG
ncbi:MAG: 2-C-methyl-D-erythritol 4-phosphate cytidylyltransferase [Chlamydiae bacterium]|nr:2-C-methyl-D-erythritol 4-phosphate cytidylyltransferase [Chlamydiota bacterium]MBI3265899.1 2-C-methyl-D-erythritol 4-phosphate cytidylyltransferase [Chlamydiota bacterium]